MELTSIYKQEHHLHRLHPLLPPLLPTSPFYSAFVTPGMLLWLVFQPLLIPFFVLIDYIILSETPEVNAEFIKYSDSSVYRMV